MEYRHFGVMIDCSRNAVMKPSQVKRLIDVLVKLGYNSLELYTEDTYEVEGEPYLGFMRGRYTGAEIRDIDEYARSKGVELIPCIQTLAHFTAPAKNFAMRPLFDLQDILLCEDERTYEFIDRCFASIAKNFTSRLVNIGMDEAHMLGLGNYLKKHGYTERFDILTRHLKRVAEIAQKYGFTPHMWSDMFFRCINNGTYYGRDLHVPKRVYEQIPENVELAYWDYYTMDEAQYDDMFAGHFEMDRKVWFVGGAWSWCGFAPFNRYTLKSMRPAMKSVIKYGVKDVLITMWGNGGKECSFFALLPALYTIRQYADGNFDDKKIREDFEKLIGISYDDFCLLDLPNDTGYPDWNGTGWPENTSKCLLYQDCFQGLYDADLASRKKHIPFGEYAEKLYDATEKLGEYGYIAKVLADLCNVLEVKAYLGIELRKAYRERDREKLTRLADNCLVAARRLGPLYDSLYHLWHTENKPFGWEVQDIRIGGLERRLKTCSLMIRKYLSGELDRLEELEEEPLMTTQTDILENSYEKVVTRNIL